MDEFNKTVFISVNGVFVKKYTNAYSLRGAIEMYFFYCDKVVGKITASYIAPEAP